MHPPVISLKSKTAIQDIDEACSTWGAFVLVDHDILAETMEKVLQLGHEFFDMPLATKNKYNLQDFGAKWRGYMPLGGEKSSKGKITDAKEGLYMGDEHPADHANVINGAPTFGTNVFPDEEIPEMKRVFLMYHDQMRALGDQMMKILAIGLGLDEGYIQDNITQHEPVILPRMFRYEKQREQRPLFHQRASVGTGTGTGASRSDAASDEEIQWGIGRHSDYGLWTMVLTDSPGLEFQHPHTGSWHKVPFVKHGIIMNVGDVLDRLTSGRYISAYHRACNLSTTSYRLTLPFFYDPSWTAKMQRFPIDNPDEYDTPARQNRWSQTNIACIFDGNVEYSEFLAKKVAKVFPELVPESCWINLKSTLQPSTLHALEVKCPDISIITKAEELVKEFYVQHSEIKVSHGWGHIESVVDHTNKAILSLEQTLPSTVKMEIKLAALLHDMDDKKYFDTPTGKYPNADKILKAVGISSFQNAKSHEQILKMISWVSCSTNGNKVPPEVEKNNSYHLLIPRWADRLTAVGAKGVVRCYQYNQECGRPLSSEASPKPSNEDELWSKYTLPSKLDEYMKRGGTSTDMISHYYDKLLHISKPPKEIVRNLYLENQAESTSKELVEVCLRYGRTGQVDEEYIKQLMTKS